MIETIKAFIKKSPFWSGIVGGFVICLALVGLFNGLSGGGKSAFKNAEQVIKEDYLRMAVSDYAFTKNTDRARWRYNQLGKDDSGLMNLLKKDNLSDPLAILQFSQTVGDTTLIMNPAMAEQISQAQASPSDVEKSSSGGIPVVGKIILLLLIMILLGAAAVFLMSEKSKPVKNAISGLFGKLKKAKPSSWQVKRDESFDLGKLVRRYPEGSSASDSSKNAALDSDLMIEREFVLSDGWDDPDEPSLIEESVQFGKTADASEMPEAYASVPLELTEASDEAEDVLSADEISLDELEALEEAGAKDEGAVPDEANNAAEALEIGEVNSAEDDQDALFSDEQEDLDDLGIDFDDADDELFDEYGADDSLKADEITPIVPTVPVIPLTEADLETVSESADAIKVDVDENELVALSKKNEKIKNTEPLIHYQTVYKLGDDFFDETFSLDDADDKFIGECGIGIAETINNTEPRAVTAFEIWLFDRDDVQTPTHFLLSDFAFSNAEMLERLKNKGRFDLIEANREYEVLAQSLKMIVTVKEIDYGAEGSNRKSYFNKVTFDVRVWQI